MAEYRTVEVRLYPNNDQRVQLNKTIGCARKIWNLMLGESEEHYKKTGKHRLLTPAAFKEAYDYLKEVDSLALANRQLELTKAFKNFFKKVTLASHLLSLNIKAGGHIKQTELAQTWPTMDTM